MQWTLFARLEHTVAHARKLDPQGDAPTFARVLREHVPELFAGFSDDEDPQAQAAALTVATAALKLLRRLPRQIDEAAASLVDATPAAPNEDLAKIAALAYVACSDDLLPDDQPAGYGLLDDALLLRAAELGPASAWDYDARIPALGLELRFLSLLLPRDLLPAVDVALCDLLATSATYHRFPLAVLKETSRRLIEQPPATAAELLDLADQAAAAIEPRPVHRPPLFAVVPGKLEAVGDTLQFGFDDGVRIELAAGALRQI
ncbi:MAG: hypothetical protein KC457_09495 [Myxococcales bacterium]|nr:hypothetical protein [Myxococcales bacterium]